MMLAGAEIVKDSVAFKKDEIGNSEAVIAPGPSQLEAVPTGGMGLTRTPTKEPVDIQFTNVTYTVSLGINKDQLISANPE
ncbi:unnamed protein product [Euphydryas editha]|uniref:Uncharacterized protein n=1 Tax=Euphydryas editha TaxID=104508 RepID=A0AAU9V9M2_EUPED|nr:unnamed protein product [Euphydryas editha]